MHLCISQAPDDSYVSDVVRAGSRVEPWEAGSNAFPPSGMRATDLDALVLSPTEGWTTAVERPAEGGTLLATQVVGSLIEIAWVVTLSTIMFLR